MSYEIIYKPAAEKCLDALDRAVRVRALAAIGRLAENPRPPNCLKMDGMDSTYRLRVGDYRVIYDILDDKLVVFVLKVKHRREVYR